MERAESKTFHASAFPVNGVLNQFDVFMRIDEIYDDFESMTCENCINSFTSENYQDLLCKAGIKIDTRADAVEKDFGCNRFKINKDN